MKRKRIDLPAIVVKFSLESTEEVQVFGFRVVAKFRKGDYMTFINGAIFIRIKGDVSLEAGRPLVNIAFDLEVLRKLIYKLIYNRFKKTYRS